MPNRGAMNQEPNNYSTRSDERYRDVGFTRKATLKACQPESSESDRLRARRHLHDSATHHDRGRRNTDKQAYVEEEDPETGTLHRWEPESDQSSVHGRAEGISEQLASRPKQENRNLFPKSVTTNKEARKGHERDRVSRETERRIVDGERHHDTLEDHGLTEDYIEGYLSVLSKQHERPLRNWMMADIKRQLRLQNDLQERAVREATDLKSIMARIRGTSWRATSTPGSQKPGASSSTRTQASSTSSTPHILLDQGEDSHKNFDSRQTYAHRTTRGLSKEQEDRKREEIKENRRENAARDAAALASVQTSRPEPIIANGMSSSRGTASYPTDRKPSTSSRTRPQISPINSSPDALSVRSARPDHTTRERKTVIEQSPSIYHSRRLNCNFEDSTTPSGSRPSAHRATKSRNGHRYVDAGCQTDASLAKAGSVNKQPSLSREDVAKELDFWI